MITWEIQKKEVKIMTLEQRIEAIEKKIAELELTLQEQPKVVTDHVIDIICWANDKRKEDYNE